MSKLFVSIAFRFGQENGHWYLVDAHDDLDAAIANARQERDDRAGKYGVAVYRCGNGEHTIEHYEPSVYGEEAPRFNRVIWLRQSVGAKVLNALEDRDVEFPQWLMEIVDRESKIAQALESGKAKG